MNLQLFCNQKNDKIKVVKSFDELLSIVEFSSIKGIGGLTKYDTALRIGNFIDFFPDKIYLHAGALQGAEIILQRKITESYIYVNDLPKPFQTSDLSTADIENMLCICKKSFASLWKK